MRRLGDELGAAAMSLYNHVAGREALLDGLSEVLVAGIGAEPAGDEPRERLRRFMSGIRAVALAHPDAFRLVGMRPLHTPRAFRPVDDTLGALRAIGLADQEAVHAYRALVSYARGYALAEIAGFTLEAAGAEPPAPVGPDELRAEGLENLAELAPHLLRSEHDAAFEFGMESILDGIEARMIVGEDQPIEVVVELEAASEPIRGAVRTESGRRLFEGWMELTAALEDARRPPPES